MARRSAALLAALFAAATGHAQQDPPWRGAPIHYDAPSDADDDAAAQLAARLRRDDAAWPREPRTGLLPELLRALDIPESSQTLVFSKTSFQNDRIGPGSPRAIYFGDSAYVGYVPGSPVLEVAAIDTARGPVFYSVTDRGDRAPEIRRDDASCLTCHAFAWTGGWPGLLVRSVFPDPDGLPIQRLGSDVVDHDTPWAQRWGGWYVTGATGTMAHRGNLTWPADADEPAVAPGGLDLASVADRFDASRYPTPHSDVVALMVLEHQTRAHNAIARANHVATLTLARQQEIDAALDRPGDTWSDATRDAIHALADDLLAVLLFRDEPPLPSPVTGSSRFVAEFPSRGPRDAAGRSLRDFDLRTRLFRWPLSYVIQGEAFRALHPAVRDVVLLRLERILTGRFGRRTYRHLTPAMRATMLAIVRATVADLPANWATDDDRR